MIPLSELRIQNLVDFEGQILPVLAIDSESELDFKTGEIWKGTVSLPQMFNGRRISTLGVWVNKITPIPISGDWLEQFGGINNGQNIYDFEDGRWSVLQRRDKFMYKDGKYKEVRTVHQFQNIYFALNDKEIERKQIIEKI